MSRPVVAGKVVKPLKRAHAIKPSAADSRHLLAAMLVESSDDAIIGMTRQSVITTWNRAAQRLYGYKAAEVVGKNVSLLLPPDRLDEVEAVQERAEVTGAGHAYETRRVHKDGRLLDVA